MKRCTRCILPEAYPESRLNEEGVCNHCTTYTPIKYLGDAALKERIQSYLQTRNDRNPRYDCLLALSGGRDSSYLLYYLVRVLGLKVLAYSIDNGFIPEQTRANLLRMTDTLNVELVIEKDDALDNCIKHHIQSFIRRPSAAMIGLLCTGCRHALDSRVPLFARKHHVPLIISGSNPLDSWNYYKTRLITLTPSGKHVPFLWGYMLQVMRNPSWIVSLTSLTTQFREYWSHFRPGRRQSDDLWSIAPFYDYIRWEESEIVSTIEDKLAWRKHSDMESTWRGDCDIALLKLYLYKQMLGYNDKDVELSYLIWDGQISREKAMKRLEKEGEVSEKAVRQILNRLGLAHSSLDEFLAKVRASACQETH